MKRKKKITGLIDRMLKRKEGLPIVTKMKRTKKLIGTKKGKSLSTSCLANESAMALADCPHAETLLQSMWIMEKDFLFEMKNMEFLLALIR